MSNGTLNVTSNGHANGTTSGTTYITSSGKSDGKFEENASDFPPGSWLGYGFDMTEGHSLTSIQLVCSSLKSAYRLLKIDEKGEEQTVYGAVKWKVPTQVAVSADTGEAEVSSLSFTNGTEATSAFQAGAAITVAYGPFSGSADVSYATTTSFKSDCSYYFYNYSQDVVHARIQNWADLVNDDSLQKILEDLPAWNSADLGVQNEYRSLYRTVGSHIVTSTAYGSRLTLTVWASNSNETYNKDFEVNVKAEYKSIMGSVGGEAEVKTTDSYKAYIKTENKHCECRGGDESLAGEIEANPAEDSTEAVRLQWIKTASAHPNVERFEVQALWDVVRKSNVKKFRDLADDLNAAFTWICQNPKPYLTRCTFTAKSDWGSFVLLSNSATIIAPQAVPDFCTFTDSKLSWVTTPRNVAATLVVEFTIENDGSGVDIELSHGSSGDGQPQGGQCAVKINKATYVNNTVTDNVTNSKRFLQCPVNPVPS